MTMQHARIYRPSKSAMTSGKRNTHKWVLEFVSTTPQVIDPLMGWTGTKDTKKQIKLRFPTKEEALAYAKKYGIAAEILPEHSRMRIIKPYADNFK
ncbi:ETC complex I subunit [Iodidimonas muriae]|nr:ETC complex I subunit [Iodidimonas muriae]